MKENNMKKLPLSIVFLTSVVYLAGCSATNTQVRLLALTYSLPGVQTQSARLNERNLPTKKNADIEEYIFPGDVLTFTVELEDPNFEFISLLAIKFNGVTIRANTNDSIVDTRDCGANICLDFPFEVSTNVTEYTVQEVKFAKLNGESGINAIIDSNSSNSISLDYYDGEIFPYVQSSVEVLNNRVQVLEYFNDGDFVGPDKRPGNVGYMERGFFVSNYSTSTPAFEKIFIQTGIYNLDGMTSSAIESIMSHDYWNFYDENGHNDFRESQYLFLKYVGLEYDTGEGNYFMYLQFFEEKYKEVFFYNEGNSIYVDILGEQLLFLEMVNGMKIQPFIEGFSST